MQLKPSNYPAFGLDIGSYSIKAVDLDHRRDGSNLRGISSVPLPNPGKEIPEQNQKKLIANLQEVVKNAKPKRIKSRFVVSALPESKVFSEIVEMPKMEEEELTQAIGFETGKSMPLPKKDLYFDFSILKEKKEGKLEILIVGAEKRLVNFYREIIKAAGFQLLVMETKPIAALRALISPAAKSNVLSIDIGAKNSSITLAEKGKFRSSITLSFGGDRFVEAIVKNLKKTRNKAIELLEKSQKEKEPNQEILRILYPHFEEINGKIADALKFWSEKRVEEPKIEKIILSGGGSVTPGLADYITKNVEVKTEIGNPLININPESRKNIDRFRIMRFTTAIGLSLRRIDTI